jgi:ParB/RepB/Spo0J family partition protein
MAQISITLIDPPAWNSRMEKTGAALKREEEKIDELSKSFTAEGQLTPVELEQKDDGRFELVFGSRRLRAARKLGWESIEANVKPMSSAGQRILRNIIENEQRENLTSYEQARAYSQLRDLGLKNNEIGAKLGKSPQHVSNLYTQYANLSDPIKKEWASNNPVATFDNLRALANKEQYPTEEKQVRAWDDLCAVAAKHAAEGGKIGKRGKGKGNGGSNGSFHVVKANMELALDLLSPRKVAEEKIGGTKGWTNQLIQWLIGQRKTPPDGIAFPVKEEK